MTQALKLGNNITAVKWNGWTVRGEDTNHVIVEMIAMLNLSRRQIAPVFNVSYQTICNRVDAFKEEYPDKWAEVESKKQFYDTFKDLYTKNDGKLSIIAERLDISVNKARQLRSKLIPQEQRLKKISIKSRQNILCHALFGYEYNTSLYYETQLKEWIKNVSPKDARNRLIAYYLEGKDTTLDERRQRMYDIDLIRQYLIENIKTEDLLEQEVICKNRKLYASK